MLQNSDFREAVDSYLERYPSERDDLVSLLNALDEDAALVGRDRFAGGGHITCGAAIMNGSGEALFIYNKPLEKWLLPGGHLEETDTSLQLGAMREMLEETGIQCSDLVYSLNNGEPLEIALYEIPANAKKREPAHWHADFCFGFLVADPTLVLQVAEIGGSQWRKGFDDVSDALAQRVDAALAARPC